MYNPITLGEDGIRNSHQKNFPKTTKCVHCNGTSRIGFVYYETDEPYVCNIHRTTGKKGGYWLHDACAVAVYFCKDCLNTTALYNQA
jgi:hypothetical protein